VLSSFTNISYRFARDNATLTLCGLSIKLLGFVLTVHKMMTSFSAPCNRTNDNTSAKSSESWTVNYNISSSTWNASTVDTYHAPSVSQCVHGSMCEYHFKDSFTCTDPKAELGIAFSCWSNFSACSLSVDLSASVTTFLNNHCRKIITYITRWCQYQSEKHPAERGLE
jgi:hypothetical protein